MWAEICGSFIGMTIAYFLYHWIERIGYKQGYEDGVHDRKNKLDK